MSDQPQTPKPTIPPVGEWLCRKAWNASNLADANDEAEVVTWDDVPPDQQQGYWVFAQSVLVAMHGVEIAEMLIGCKAEILAMVKAMESSGSEVANET